MPTDIVFARPSARFRRPQRRFEIVEAIRKDAVGMLLLGALVAAGILTLIVAFLDPSVGNAIEAISAVAGL